MDSSSQALWYVTFGARYSYEMHPWCPVIHPDTVVKIVAPDYEMARELTVRLFGQQWSNLHEWDLEHIKGYYSPTPAFTVRWTDPEIADLVLSISQVSQGEWVASMVRPALDHELFWGDTAYA